LDFDFTNLMGLSSPKTLIYRLMDLDTLILMSFFLE